MMLKKIKLSDILLAVCAVAVVLALGSLTTHGKKKTEKLVIGDWYRQWSESVTFTIYDDGTVNIPGSYGMGKWSVANEDQLILTDFYGETTILKIEHIDGDNMEVREVVDGRESEETITFAHTAEGAQTVRVRGYY